MEEKVYASSRGEIRYWCSIKRNSPICLVLLHGLTADHRLFYQQVKAFSKRYFLLLWDAPGHGLSRPYTDFSYDHCADDLFQILQQEGIQKVVLVGQSMGGFISQSFISKFPH